MDKIYSPLLINLDKRADRLEESRIEFEKLNLDYRRISASNRPQDGALGCLESHCICLEQFLSTNQGVVMICEDDISFNCHRDELDKYVNMFYRIRQVHFVWDFWLDLGNHIRIHLEDLVIFRRPSVIL